MKKWFITFLIFSCCFLLWETISAYYSHMAFILPQPSKIVAQLWSRSDRFLLHSWYTFKEMMGGFLLALAIAFPLAAVMNMWNTLRMVLQPIFIIIQCVPMFTLAPIMVIWFGWSYTAIVLPTALMIFFPMTINIYQGLRSTPTDLLDYFRVNQATLWQIFTKLQLPWALPHICAGFRISAAIAGIGAVAGEWAGAQKGLGMLMLESRRGADLETTFGALFCLTFMSLALYTCMTLLERRISQRKPFYIKEKLKSPKFIFATSFGLIAIFLISSYMNGEKYVKQHQNRLVLDWLPNPNHVPLYVGIEKGFFDKHEVPIAIKKLNDPSDIIPLLTSRQVDLAVNYMPSTLKAVSHGAEVVVVGLLIKEPLNSILFLEGKGIASPSDLNDKIVGYSIDGTESGYLNALLKIAKIKTKERYNISFDLETALGTHQVDAVYGAYWNIETEHLRSLNIPTGHFTVTQLGMPTYYELILLAKKNTPQADPDFIQRLQAGLQESIDFCQRHPQEAFEIYCKANPDKSEKTIAWEKNAWAKTLPVFANDQNQDLKVWQNYYDWQNKFNILSHAVDVKSLIGK